MLPSNAGHEKNNTPTWVYLIVPLITLGLGLFINIRFGHPITIHWIAGAMVWLAGGGICIWQVKNSGDTNGIPWVLWILAPFVTMFLAWTSI